MGGSGSCSPRATEIFQGQIDTLRLDAKGYPAAKQQFQPFAICPHRQQRQNLIGIGGPGATLHLIDEIKPQRGTDTRRTLSFLVPVTVTDQHQPPGACIPMDIPGANRHILHQR